mgnify:CR=1 FL=1
MQTGSNKLSGQQVRSFLNLDLNLAQTLQQIVSFRNLGISFFYINKQKITNDLLFTHFGIGGPAVYRATLLNSKEMTINFAPGIDVFELLKLLIL